MQFTGELAAISAALVWAVATWIYGRLSHRFSAFQMNIVKGVLASAMMLLVVPFLPVSGKALQPAHVGVLALSGIIGIAVGDSAYFAALKRIGANKTLLLESLAPPLSGVLALALLGSELSLQSWLGVFVTTTAVAYVVFQPSSGNRAVSVAGIGFGLLASVCQATGVVISHYALVAGDVPPLLGALIRLGVGVLVVILGIKFVEKAPFKTMGQKLIELGSKEWVWLLLAIFVGTFLALWLQQVALKYANPAVAQTLIATSPLFILLIQIGRGEPVTLKSALGCICALAGISLFFL